MLRLLKDKLHKVLFVFIYTLFSYCLKQICIITTVLKSRTGPVNITVFDSKSKKWDRYSCKRFNHHLQNMIKSLHHCWKSWEGKAWAFMGSISMCHPCTGECAGLISKQDSLMQTRRADPNKLNVGQRVCLYNTICSFCDSFLTVMCYFFFFFLPCVW